MLVDSKKTQLEVEPIIVIDAQETNDEEPLMTAYAGVLAELNMEGVIPFQSGNTLFIIHHAESRVGVFNVVNADVKENLVENFSKFMKASHFFGYDILYSYFDDPAFLDIFQDVEDNSSLPDFSYEVEKTDEAYEVTFYLGKPREGAQS